MFGDEPRKSCIVINVDSFSAIAVNNEIQNKKIIDHDFFSLILFTLKKCINQTCPTLIYLYPSDLLLSVLCINEFIASLFNVNVCEAILSLQIQCRRMF